MNAPRQYTVVGLGEVLWDIFPDGKQLGGAPANFAAMAAALGDRGVIASRIGEDALGERALDRWRQRNVEVSFIQRDPRHETGTVRVDLDDRGQPEFTITENVAWDYLEWTPQWHRLATRADVVCFGTLAQRAPRSRQTIRRFLEATRPDCLRLFDVNLRSSYYSVELLRRSFQRAEVAKLNDEELFRVTDLMGFGEHDLAARAEQLRRTFNLTLVCITRGARGSLLVAEGETIEHPGITVDVVDTVGAGDAFTAALAYHLLRRASFTLMSEAANRLGALVAARRSATPTLDEDVLEQVRRPVAQREPR